jgi:integrase
VSIAAVSASAGSQETSGTTPVPSQFVPVTASRTRAAKLAPKTRERYANVTCKYLVPEFGAMPLAKLDRPTIKQWFAALSEDGCSAGTAKKINTVLSSILDEGVELRPLRTNPAARLRLAVYMAAYTGLRAGELSALQRRDVDLANRRLRVERTLTSESGRLIFRNVTKTDGSRRVISLPSFLANMLTEHLKQLPADPTSLLFTAPGGGNGKRANEGGAVRHELFRSRLVNLAVRGRKATKTRPAVPAALPADKANVRWHDLRHTCASLLIDSGASVLLISKRLGRADPSMTLSRRASCVFAESAGRCATFRESLPHL